MSRRSAAIAGSVAMSSIGGNAGRKTRAWKASRTARVPPGTARRSPSPRCGEDHPPTTALPLRSDEDHDVSEEVPRCRDQHVWRLANSEALNMNRLPASQRYKRHTGRWKRYEKQRPGHHVQIDVKFIEPIAAGTGRRKRYYQYPAIDACTRLRVLRAYPRSDQKTAIQFVDYVLSRLPFQVEKIQTDNGAEFQSSFHWHVLDQGGHIYIRPATPRLNGKVERSH